MSLSTVGSECYAVGPAQNGITRHLLLITSVDQTLLVDELNAYSWTTTVKRPDPQLWRSVDTSQVSCVVIDFESLFDSEERSSLMASLKAPDAAHVGWIGLVARGQINDEFVRRAIGEYCFDYLTKPASVEQIAHAIGHASGMVGLRETDGTAIEVTAESVDASPQGEMIGTCDAMLALFSSIEKVARTDAPVFISGESGTGKELTALAIHQRSARGKHPFVAINCGAIPPHLLQSELFGYERGAFTGANQRKAGRVETANGGTLFLDEIGDLQFENQASFLRFIQERKIERIGSNTSTEVDVRIISATHIDTESAMVAGRFRADLYHRLCVLRIEAPPLRDRGRDIELLAHSMLARYRGDTMRRVRGFAPDAIAAIHTYQWPGNVRELINRVRRAIVMTEQAWITARDLELDLFVSSGPLSLAQARESADRQVIEKTLLRNRGRVGKTADDLGISRMTLSRLLRSRGIDIASLKTND